MMIGGVGHLVAIVSVAISQNKPYDFRLVSLIATGGILAYPGMVNLALSRWIWRGREWAFGVSALCTIPLLAYLVLLLFARIPPDSTDPFAGAGDSARTTVLINGIYLAVLFSAWVPLRRRSSSSPWRMSGQ